jgi:hypothetical protein
MDYGSTALGLVIDEIASRAPNVGTVIRDSETSWALRYDEGHVLHLAERDDPPRLEIMSSVTSLPADCPAEVLKMAMMFNFLSQDSGGTRMGLCTPGDVIYVVRDIPVSEWTVPALQERLAQVMAVADNWAQFFERALGAGVERVDSPALAGQFV